MGNVNSKVEIILHIDDEVDEARRREMTTALEKNEDVYTAEFCPLRYHLILVNYNKENFSSKDVLNIVNEQGVTAQLIGPV